MMDCGAGSGEPVAEIVIPPRSVTARETNIDHCKRRLSAPRYGGE
jgi:hypothetical protein